MSALEPSVRVNSEKQTLILAGEPVPRRPLTIVATPVDDPLLIVHGGSEDLSSELAVFPRNPVPSHKFIDRGTAYSPANAYARTQELSISSARAAIIDTYA
jgi:hypothetical protein